MSKKVSSVARTTISLLPDVLRIARERASALAYESQSAYLAFLINADAENVRGHRLVRTEGAVRHEIVLRDAPAGKEAA